MFRPTFAVLNIKSLKNNLKIVQKIASKSQIWAVIKANAYGHGIKNVWKSLSSSDGFAVLNLKDAIQLRELGWEKPILMLEGFFTNKEIKIFNYYNLTSVIHSYWQIQELEKIVLRNPLNIYLKVNSSMNRLGFKNNQINYIWKKLSKNINIKNITLMAHFANTDKTNDLNLEINKINQFMNNIKYKKSFSNSAAIVWHQQIYNDWVRAGIILYGASPNDNWNDIVNIGIKPVMSLYSKIISIQKINSGDKVGYSPYCYQSESQKRIGIVACGYADGYPKNAPYGTPVIVDGIKTHIIGVVCMDMLIVDLTYCEQAKIGSHVELWGENIKINEIAKLAGTIGYDIMCSLNARVPIQII